MFVQSARFVAEHKKNGTLSIHGVEKVDDTGRLCRLNLAVHGGHRLDRARLHFRDCNGLVPTRLA